MLRTLAVGTDGSDSALRAVGHAARLADALEARLLVVHAYGGNAAPDSPVGSRDIGASLLRDVTQRYAENPRVRPVLAEGDAAEVLLDVATRESADLVVVGNRGMGQRRIRIGNVPNRIAHRAPSSVLIAQTTGRPRARTYDKVLIATDGSETAGRAVAFGADLVATVGAETLLLHVGTSRNVAERAAAALPANLAVTTATVDGEPAARIVEVARAENCDLVVIGNRGMTGIRRFLASVPSRVAHDAPCHVLLVKTT